MSRLELQTRERRLVNTDPQRRCYNGCHFSSRLVWSDWETLECPSAADVEAHLQFWRELNDYAVSQRGKEAKREFRVVETA